MFLDRLPGPRFQRTPRASILHRRVPTGFVSQETFSLSSTHVVGAVGADTVLCETFEDTMSGSIAFDEDGKLASL